MEKISAWLRDNVHSHSIYSHLILSKDFKEKTGHDAEWPTSTSKQMMDAINERGVGGELKAEPAEILVSGYEVAEALAKKHTNYDRGNIDGRGTRFHLAVDMLEAAGF